MEMQKRFKPYIFLKKFLSPMEIAEILAVEQKKKYEPARVTAKNIYNSYIPSVRKSPVIYFRSPSLREKTLGAMERENKKYWQFAGKFTEPYLQLARYRKNDRFLWHVDSGYVRSLQKNIPRERVLTMIVLLSNASEFTGGDLELIDFREKKYRLPLKNAGDAVVFPSTQKHRVLEIRSGERRTLTTWAIASSPWPWVLMAQLQTQSNF